MMVLLVGLVLASSAGLAAMFAVLAAKILGDWAGVAVAVMLFVLNVCMAKIAAESVEDN